MSDARIAEAADGVRRMPVDRRQAINALRIGSLHECAAQLLPTAACYKLLTRCNTIYHLVPLSLGQWFSLGQTLHAYYIRSRCILQQSIAALLLLSSVQRA